MIYLVKEMYEVLLNMGMGALTLGCVNGTYKQQNY